MELDPFDEIFVQGVKTEELSFGNVTYYSNLGETLDGIGIYASGTLKLYTSVTTPAWDRLSQ